MFDTAHAYGHGDAELGHNERLLAGALRDHGAAASARIVTKGGMTRPGGGWVPDGRAKALRRDCEASLAALGGLPIDLYLIHAPDPRTPWRTSVRALARLRDEGLVRHVGLSNVNRGQLDEALELAPIAAVEVALGPHDDRALRGGIVERCDELQIAVIAHSPLGGPRRAGALARRGPLAEIAQTLGATPAEVALAWLLDLSPVVVPIPGARRPADGPLGRERRGARPRLRREDGPATRVRRPALAGRRGPAAHRSTRRRRGARDGHPGGRQEPWWLTSTSPAATSASTATSAAARLRDLADALDGELSSGARRVVLDNTYLTRAARSHVIETANRHGLPARCVWLDTPLAQAQVNLVERMLDAVRRAPDPG